MERYRLYIDESGDHVMKDEATLVKEKHRYLSLVGCWIEDAAYVKFHDKLEDLKQKHFPHSPDKPIILHRDDMVGCRGPFWRLRDEANRKAFDDDLISLLKTTDFTISGVVIDKMTLKQKYVSPFHPYHMAMDFLLQRYCGYLNHVSRSGDVMAESRGGSEDRELSKAFVRIWCDGDMHHEAEFFQRVLTSKQLKLKKKADNIAGLQLVDLLAHPLRCYALMRSGMAKMEPTPFEQRIFEVLKAKFNKNLFDGTIKGYGWVLFPNK